SFYIFVMCRYSTFFYSSTAGTSIAFVYNAIVLLFNCNIIIVFSLCNCNVIAVFVRNTYSVSSMISPPIPAIALQMDPKNE
ncbi:hypothetical protein L9F63_011266, partial [Diploptera punctata]